MLWDLGVDEVEDAEMVSQKILEIEQKFDLVMIAEKFDESLLLLRDIFCWDFDDITSLKLNSRKESSRKNLNETTKIKLKEYLKYDYQLYNHFKDIIVKKLRDFGESKLEKDLELLKIANAKRTRTCSIIAEDNSALRGDSAWWGPDLVGYKVSTGEEEECKLMVMAELRFIDRIRLRQLPSNN